MKLTLLVHMLKGHLLLIVVLLLLLQGVLLLRRHGLSCPVLCRHLLLL
jgi:hypothetical protein